MANILTILFIQVIQVGHMSFGHSAGVLLMQIGVGAVAGYVLGRISLFFVNRLDVDNQSQYPILLLALVFFIFSFTDLIGGQRLFGRLSRRSGDRQQQDAASPQHDDLFRRYRLARPAGHVSDARPARQSDRAAARRQASDC